MADIDVLNETLDAIGTDVATQTSKLRELESELSALQASTPPEVDLTGVIAKAQAIRTSLESVATTAAQATGGGAQTQPDTTA